MLFCGGCPIGFTVAGQFPESKVLEPPSVQHAGVSRTIRCVGYVVAVVTNNRVGLGFVYGRESEWLMSHNKHIKYAPVGRRTFVNSGRLCERYASQK